MKYTSDGSTRAMFVYFPAQTVPYLEELLESLYLSRALRQQCVSAVCEHLLNTARGLGRSTGSEGNDSIADLFTLFNYAIGNIPECDRTLV